MKVPEHETILKQIIAKNENAKILLNPNQPNTPIHLIGDSFLNVFSPQKAGLHSHLVNQLGIPINKIAKLGNSVYQARKEFIRNKHYKKAKILIWQIAEKMP